MVPKIPSVHALNNPLPWSVDGNCDCDGAVAPFIKLYDTTKVMVTHMITWCHVYYCHSRLGGDASVGFEVSCQTVIWPYAAAAAKSLQSCPTLCDPIDGSPQGSTIPGILQARTLEWVAISFSNEWKWKVKVKSISCVWLLATPWTAAYQAPPSMGFSRQEYWSGLPLPSPNSFTGDF